MTNAVFHIATEVDVTGLATLEASAKAFAAQLAKAEATASNMKRELARADDLRKAEGSTSSGSGGEDAADKDTGDKKMLSRQIGAINQGITTVATAGMGIVKNTFGILSDIFERIKGASPLLQAVETLFNLAMQLFFMPLGTKLATVLIPRVIELVDGVMAIWDGFEDKSLSDILKDTVQIGAKVFGEFFQNIGSDLKQQGGILGSIGSALDLLGDFIENGGEKLIEVVMNVMNFVLRNLPTILGTIVGLLILQKGLMIAQIVTTGSITPWSIGIGAAAIAGAIGGGLAIGSYAKSQFSAADGGYFPATPGGVSVLIAEGGEGETVVPDGKKVDFAKSVLSGSSGNTFNIYVNGYTDTDLENKIVRVINEQTNLSRLRSGF